MKILNRNEYRKYCKDHNFVICRVLTANCGTLNNINELINLNAKFLDERFYEIKNFNNENIYIVFEDRNERESIMNKLDNQINAFHSINNEEVKSFILNFKDLTKSPYSNSYYDSDNITWDFKPLNSLRISDHWNFYSENKTHCKLNETDKYDTRLMCCKFNGVDYEIVKEF